MSEDYQPFYKTAWSAAQVKRVLGLGWYKYEHHFDELSDEDILKARQFYYRFSYLSNEERDLLKAHYYSDYQLLTEVPKDSVMAVKYGMSVKDYRIRRATIESKLKAYRAEPKQKQVIDRKELWAAFKKQFWERYKSMYGNLIK
ncbi:MAG: hypothetical protein ABF723_04060 [Lentilactobacillus hilgardii]|uniref:hypothetical protein n=1 Tax=Lactobacillaceae TaxID=33958 RepID=UPI001CC21E7E|nr:hypothetical protein [Lentilactobacillus hilgardii]MBZ2200234.1 hypothetical protein [Lentilactobacillus hilgardii]MBZ2203358.1 hypothetical protein [Lentilactobacillus hilgardii]